MGYGKKAARNIDQRLMGPERCGPDLCPHFEYDQKPPEQPARARRHIPADCRAASASRASTRSSLGADRRRRRWKRRGRCLRCDIRERPTRLGGDRLDQKKMLKVRDRRRAMCRASEGQTILEVARANNKYIPTLCYLEGLSAGRAPAACAWWRSPASAACCPPAPPRSRTAWRSPPTPRSSRGIARSRSSSCFSERNHVLRRVRLATITASCRPWPRSSGVTHVRYPYNYPAAAGGHLARALRARPQPLHPLHALRAGVRRGGGRPRLGRQPRAASSSRARQRAEPAVGRVAKLHQLRQVRAGLPHRRAGREGLRRGRDDQDAMRRVSRLAARRGGSVMKQACGSRRAGWTAAPAATCRCSTWTRRSSPWLRRPTSSTARWSTPRSSPRAST